MKERRRRHDDAHRPLGGTGKRATRRPIPPAARLVIDGERPRRVQLSRRKGWRMPLNTVSVARPRKWGNPFNWKNASHDAGPKAWARGAALDLFREWLGYPTRFLDLPNPPTSDEIRRELAGKNLACWCPLDEPCHADILLEIANR